MLISLAFGISHLSIFFNKFHHNQLKIPQHVSVLEHFLVDKETYM